jgi:hypothetical protein
LAAALGALAFPLRFHPAFLGTFHAIIGVGLCVFRVHRMIPPMETYHREGHIFQGTPALLLSLSLGEVFKTEAYPIVKTKMSEI